MSKLNEMVEMRCHPTLKFKTTFLLLQFNKVLFSPPIFHFGVFITFVVSYPNQSLTSILNKTIKLRSYSFREIFIIKFVHLKCGKQKKSNVQHKNLHKLYALENYYQFTKSQNNCVWFIIYRISEQF